MKKIYLIGDMVETVHFFSQIRDKKIPYTKDLFVINDETISITKLNCEYCSVDENVDAVIFIASHNQAINNAACALIRDLDQTILVDFYHDEIDQPFKMIVNLLADIKRQQKKKLPTHTPSAFTFSNIFQNVLTLLGHQSKCESHKKNIVINFETESAK